MKRKGTLSGIIGALDYKDLNAFADVVGNFQGQKIPSVDDFNSFLLSNDSCDNLKSLTNRNTVSSSPENSSQEKNSQSRKRRKQTHEETLLEEETVALPTPKEVIVPPQPAIVKSIGDFFHDFCQIYPKGTSQYDSFLDLIKAYEGKGIDESMFYSCMKDILAGDHQNILEDFLSLIRPPGASNLPTIVKPTNNEDFPFVADSKKSKSIEQQQQVQIHQMQMQLQQQLPCPQQNIPRVPSQPSKAHPLSTTTTFNTVEVNDLVKTAVNEKAKDFLLQAKSCMDPHTYVSFLDIMVELRSLYKLNAIEEAIEKLDIAKGILTRVNPVLRVELDRYFPIVNANGAKHNLEHHTFEQSQRQYREWQQAQIARKSQHSSGTVNDFDNGNPADPKLPWWLTLPSSTPDPAQLKKDRLKLSAFEKEQIQTAKRLAKENSMLKNSAKSNGVTDIREDLLDTLTPDAAKIGRNVKSVPNRKGNPLPNNTRNISRNKGAKQISRTIKSPNQKVSFNEKSPNLTSTGKVSHTHSSMAQKSKSHPPRMDNQPSYVPEYMGMFQPPQQQIPHPMTTFSSLGHAKVESNHPADVRAGIHGESNGINGNGTSQHYPFPTQNSMMLSYPLSSLPSSNPPSGSGDMMHQIPSVNQAVSSYGFPQQHQQKPRPQVNYTPAFQNPAYTPTNMNMSSIPSHLSAISQNGSIVLPPPPSTTMTSFTGNVLPPYDISVPPPMLQSGNSSPSKGTMLSSQPSSSTTLPSGKTPIEPCVPKLSNPPPSVTLPFQNKDAAKANDGNTKKK